MYCNWVYRELYRALSGYIARMENMPVHIANSIGQYARRVSNGDIIRHKMPMFPTAFVVCRHARFRVEGLGFKDSSLGCRA